MTRLSGFFALAVFLLAACKPAAAPSDPRVESAWARPAKVGATSAAYFTIEQNGDADDRLLSVSADVGEASLHRSSNENGIARMRPIEDGIAVAGKASVALRPGGDHVMLMNVNRDLAAGDKVALRLQFEKAGEKTAMAVVGNDGGAAHGGH